MLLITISGLDGCGKTTHVARLAEHLKGKGHRVRILESAHVSLGAAWSGTRRLVSGKRQPHRASFARPNARRVESQRRVVDRRPSQALKGWLVYPIDCVILAMWIRVLGLRGCTALVCDRYVHDKIVNLSKPICALTRLLLWLAPKPDVAFFLDASPDTARHRRPEHDTVYYTSRYQKYRVLPEICSAFMRVPSTTIGEVQRHLERLVDARSSAQEVESSGSTALAK